MNCELGILVSRDEVLVYRDTFQNRGDSIQEVHRVPTAELLGRPVGTLSGDELDHEITAWLEHLTALNSDRAPAPPGTGREIESFLAPVLAGSRVVAGGYR